MGTATFVTDYSGSTTQFFLNLPFGETMVEQRTGAFDNWYRFNAKELDKETNLYYYGARYYNPSLSIWYGVDPLGEKMPSWSPYAYAFDNPVRFIDPDGRAPLDWVRNGPNDTWHYRSNITSEAQARAAGFTHHANGKGDINSTYNTPMSRNGINIGINQAVVLGEGGNYTVNGASFTTKDEYLNMKPIDDFGKFMAAFVSFPLLLVGSPYLVSGGSAETLLTKAAVSSGTQYLGTGDINIMSVVGDTFRAYGTGEVFGGASELSVKKLRSGESAFRTVFNGSMSTQETVSNIGIALGGKGLGKLNGATAMGSNGLDKKVVGANNFLIGTGMYGAAAANATEIQKKQK